MPFREVCGQKLPESWMMLQVTVFGGSGYLGRRVVAGFLRQGARVCVAVRRPERVARQDFPGGGELRGLKADLREPSALQAAVAGADQVVNAVSAYVEGGGVSYEAIHVEGARNLAEACRRAEVSGFVQISGIGADATAASRYIAARGRGEAEVREILPFAVVLRPSVLFGGDGGLVQSLDALTRRAPLLPLIGGGRTLLQPVHVDDVAEAVLRCCRDPVWRGHTLELGGPDLYSLRDIIERILRRTGRRPLLLPLPFSAARLLARFAEKLPGAPLTLAQVELLEQDNRAGNAPGLAALGIAGRSLEEEIARLAVQNAA
jgi:uncharacterized protein YbjT (DUF2867 family)